MATTPPLVADTELDYPASDGRPVAETPLHRDLMFYVIEMLRAWYAGNSMVYISGNMFWYYEQGNKNKRVSPDVQVTLGIPRLPERRVYLQWVEGKPPDVVIELTSRSTQREDEEDKSDLYARLGVREYFMFDPEGDYLDPPLQGYRLEGGEYQPIRPIGKPLTSEVLNLQLAQDGEMLRLYDPAGKRWLPLPAEALQQAEEALLRAEVARFRAEEECRRVADALQHEADARKKAEEELQRLRSKLAALRQQTPPSTPE
jgi:Uma2 family endonuclease